MLRVRNFTSQDGGGGTFQDFLVRLKGKRLMLVGDSMNRNQFESILCILREGLHNKSRMYEVHEHKITKGRGFFVFKFENYFPFSSHWLW
ncbi:hypothetical protein AAZV13_18G149900 [Glycine max]